MSASVILKQEGEMSISCLLHKEEFIAVVGNLFHFLFPSVVLDLPDTIFMYLLNRLFLSIDPNLILKVVQQLPHLHLT